MRPPRLALAGALAALAILGCIMRNACGHPATRERPEPMRADGLAVASTLQQYYEATGARERPRGYLAYAARALRAP